MRYNTLHKTPAHPFQASLNISRLAQTHRLAVAGGFYLSKLPGGATLRALHLRCTSSSLRRSYCLLWACSWLRADSLACDVSAYTDAMTVFRVAVRGRASVPASQCYPFPTWGRRVRGCRVSVAPPRGPNLSFGGWSNRKIIKGGADRTLLHRQDFGVAAVAPQV